MSGQALLIATPLDVRWGDMDALAHVNNSVYATYLEEARLRWFATFEGGWIDESTGPVVAASQVNFRAQLAWPARLVVELFVERAGSSSLTLGFRIRAESGPQTLYADGTTVLVWVDRATGRAVPLPAHVRRAAGL